MAEIIDPATGFVVGDPGSPSLLTALTGEFTPETDAQLIRDIRSALDGFILSVSGFRKICAADADEESTTSAITAEDAALSALFAALFLRLIREKATVSSRLPNVVVGIDARPTGPTIADTVIRSLLAAGANVRYLFIVAAPEIMAYTRLTAELDGFVYISASHNPVGHNGMKFGLNRGGVLEPDDGNALIGMIRKAIASDEELLETLRTIASGMSRIPSDRLNGIFTDAADQKRQSAATYSAFTSEVVSGSENREESFRRLATLKNAVIRRRIGVLGELNGSARGTSIDREFLTELGVTVSMLNDRPRQIVHRIIPEGESLDLARRELKRLNAEDSAFALGYVPDNDGDRGNLVYITGAGLAQQISAQDVFALACVSELAWLVYTGILTYDHTGRAREKVAIAVNGPTSLRIERIADAFNAHVFRAEVGEANVVELARRLRKKGYIVRILGEGSNGGNITHPAAVRDPLNTLLAVIKLLAIDSAPDGSKPGLFDIWCAKSGQELMRGGDRDLTSILETLPRFVTTGTAEERAIMHISTRNHGTLKAEYERLFPVEWHNRKDALRARFGVVGWREINYDGIDERQGVGRSFRSLGERGGLKIVFKDGTGKIRAFIWMRGSGTEPVFRVMADVESNDPDDEAYLLEWHRDMVKRADLAAAAIEAGTDSGRATGG